MCVTHARQFIRLLGYIGIIFNFAQLKPTLALARSE
jgi:hypothetical protein